MTQRRLYLDEGPGETRGVVMLDGLPERLLIARPGDIAALALGARSVGRVRRIERAHNAAFVALPGAAEGFLGLREGQPKLIEGEAVEVEIKAEPRSGKLAQLRLLNPAADDPRLLAPGPDPAAQLAEYAAAEIQRGAAAREAADLAVEAALATEYALPSGGSIAIQPTRALVAIDVDLGAALGDSKKAARRANLEALAHGARLLRLKGLGGLVVFDLVGKGHDANALLNTARTAFAPDNPGVVLGQISRFGALEMVLPHRRAPLRLDGAGARAAELARQLERAARSDPGGRFEGLCSPEVAEATAPLVAALNARFGTRLSLAVEPGRTKLEVRPL